ncbi:MAG TPA: TraR/DksA C4-type zinc finger protein [Pirellulales bacterium]|nr:TraR/DksA C4-type zinc finger protein [Pirellulales bacterium]
MRKVAMEKCKQTLLEIRDRLLGEVNHLIQSVPEKANGGDLSHVPTHNADRDSEGLDGDLEIIHNEETILADVRAALNRIDQGTYGICEECQTEIDEARLEALPYTPYCINCAQKMATAP